MGDINQFMLVQRNAELVRGPILEIGSKDYGSTPNFRTLFPGSTYVGVDMAEGKGVDVVSDLTDEFGVVDARLGGMRFRTIALCQRTLCLADPRVSLRLLEVHPGGREGTLSCREVRRDA